MYATEAGADTGVPKSVAREFIAADKPGKLPEHVKRAEGGGLGSTHLRLQSGGLGMSMSMADPPWVRSEQRQIMDQPFHGGLIPSSGAGRTDQLPLAVAADSHVAPAAEVSGLGQGNTLSGARILSSALRIGPYGVELPQHIRGPGPPRPPGIPRGAMGYAEGGDANSGNADVKPSETQILAAGGEYVIPHHDWVGRDEHGKLWLHAGVNTIGEGNTDRGHQLLNQAIMRIRGHTLDFLRTAPKPKE